MDSLLLLLYFTLLWTSSSSQPQCMKLGFCNSLFSLDELYPGVDVWVRFTDDLLYS